MKSQEELTALNSNVLSPSTIRCYSSIMRSHFQDIMDTEYSALHSLRISEILALDQTSISNGVIYVRGAVVPDKDNKPVYKKTNKNATSTRDIPVMIPRLLEIWPKKGNTLHFQGQSSLRRQIQRVCKANGLPDISVHCLRHSFASLAYHLRWDMMTTCRIGGWNTSYCVEKIYTHLSIQDRNKDIEAMKKYYTSIRPCGDTIFAISVPRQKPIERSRNCS